MLSQTSGSAGTKPSGTLNVWNCISAEKSTTAGAATTVSGKFSPGWLAEQDSRKELVAEVCNRYPENKGSLDEVLSDKRLQSHLWVSDQQKIVFCMIAKVSIHAGSSLCKFKS